MTTTGDIDDAEAGWVCVALALLTMGSCGATCSRSEVRSSDAHETVTLDAGVRVEESAVLRVDRQEVRVQGPVEVVRVEEDYHAPEVPDAGTVLIRRVTTTTHRDPSTRTVNTEAHAEAHSEAVATVSEARATETATHTDVERKTDVGLSWPVKVALLVAVLLALALAWRFRRFLGWPGP